MKCKTCESSLRTDFSFCPTCGGKIIRNRLTLRNIWQDLSFQVFNLDNTLFKTFKHLFSRPEVVINSFIAGARKKYMNPVSYFAIAITLSGILFFILRNVYHINLTQNSFSDSKTPNMDFIFDYQGLLSYLIMPIYALLTWILFLDLKKLNYTEHLVANAYITAQVSFVQVLACLPLFGLFDIRYDLFNWLFLLISVAYQFFVFKKIHQIGIGSIVLRAIGYLFMVLIVMLTVGVLIGILAILTGKIDIKDFAPK
ncbi:DUF3667 domain-containing protein [Allomuricauda sp. SCSIO 65647]|uniref:DUF3667 domain-containing protein n=1 Tax=Allomuricauda sp. SCSIO 65647 TaxID=2908843 RepID=UPI001F2939F3|nr:DUF3667 domain-containing protein [Muricauda sp. SCSIO 65647]UJH66721.1 DUF3667 domain-containing protein [Muricauda sp. SCSIO 65647]